MRMVGWLGVFNVPPTARSFRDGIPIYCPHCEGREARFLHRSHRESNPCPSRGSPSYNRCATPAPCYEKPEGLSEYMQYYTII